jgi:putative tryptophan/tyrosine transport system substrate-binding protein
MAKLFSARALGSWSDNPKSKIENPKLVALLATIAFAIGVATATAQQQVGKIPRAGLIAPGAPERNPQVEGFRQALRELGYVEGQTLHIDYRFAEGRDDRIADLAGELVRLKVDVIVSFSHRVSLIVKKVTTTIPVVFVFVNDPVGVGLVPSLARPEGNITGVSLQGLDLIGKRLELLKETVPKVNRLVYLRNPAEPYSPAYWKQVQSTSPALGIRQVSSLETKNSDDFDKAFAAMARQHPDALLVETNSLNTGNRKRIADFAVDHRLPTMCGLTYFMDAGALMSYSPNLSDHFHRTAILFDKVIKGTKPADLPVEQPTKFEFIINLTTARQIGLTIPPNVLARADKVIK